MEEVREWQRRPLDEVYPIVIFDALRVKIRDEGAVRSKAVYLALGFTMEGRKEVLGLWIEQTEGARFWLRVMTEIKNRGCGDVFIAVVDGLKGFPEAINAVFPETCVQTCIVHMIRHSLNYVGWKERKAVAGDLKSIYRAESADAAALRLDEFERKWGDKLTIVTVPAFAMVFLTLFRMRNMRVRLSLTAGKLPRPPVCNPCGQLPDFNQFTVNVRLPVLTGVPHRPSTVNSVCDLPRVVILISRDYLYSASVSRRFPPAG